LLRGSKQGCLLWNTADLPRARAHPSQAFAQRSDHLALIAAFNGWVAARAVGGRGSGTDFARQHFLSEQVRVHMLA
jgi:hypothetical protein